MTDAHNSTGESTTDPLSELRGYAGVFEQAANATDDPDAADAYAVLAAVARGESPPGDVARRVVDRAKSEK